MGSCWPDGALPTPHQPMNPPWFQFTGGSSDIQWLEWRTAALCLAGVGVAGAGTVGELMGTVGAGEIETASWQMGFRGSVN